MIRRVPVLPTLIVLVAVGIMVRLGFWQLDRLGQKEALLAQYSANVSNLDLVDFPVASSRAAALVLYRRSQITCRFTSGWEAVAGTNSNGQSGWAHVVLCDIAADRTAHVVIGWSNNPARPDWRGGRVSGVISPGGPAGARLVADPPLAGLKAMARPNPANIPNNHLSYAVQWFLFALTALVIYVLALRKRLNPPRNGVVPRRGGGVPPLD